MILRWAWIALLAAPMLVSAGPASAAMTEAEVKAKVVEAYGVEVLRIRRAGLDGRDVFLVTVMNPGGDFDEAFQVNTIAFDAETGAPVPRFRHLASGVAPNEAPTYDAGRQATDAMQSGVIWR